MFRYFRFIKLKGKCFNLILNYAFSDKVDILKKNLLYSTITKHLDYYKIKFHYVSKVNLMISNEHSLFE